MECRRQLDAACCSAVGHPLICAAAVFLLLACYILPGTAQPILTDENHLTQIEQLAAEERWQEIVRLAETAPTPSAELDYYYGIALARSASQASFISVRAAMLSRTIKHAHFDEAWVQEGHK